MSSPLVPAIEFIHVPVPWRSLLPGWLTRLWPSRTWIIRIPLQDRRRKVVHQGRRHADSGAGLKYRPRNTTMRLISSIGEWLDERLQIDSTISETAEHEVPRKPASWFYVFGSAAFAVFMLQIVTGILLALIYVPSA